MPRRALTVSELIAACVAPDEESHLRIEMSRTFIWEAAALTDFLNEISATPISASRVYPLVAHGDLPCALKSERSPTRKGHTSPPRPHHRRRLIDGPAGGPDLRNRGVASRPGAPGKTREMNRTPLRWQVPSGGGCFVREGGRAPAVSGMRRNPEAEIHPLSPDLRGRYRIDMQERFPSLGRPPGPPALSSLRALD
jgi:hypothetical protein